MIRPSPILSSTHEGHLRDGSTPTARASSSKGMASPLHAQPSAKAFGRWMRSGSKDDAPLVHRGAGHGECVSASKGYKALPKTRDGWPRLASPLHNCEVTGAGRTSFLLLPCPADWIILSAAKPERIQPRASTSHHCRIGCL